MPMPTIGIDARFYGPKARGLGRYTAQLLKYLEKNDLKNRYFVYLLKENFDAYEPKNPNFIKKLADIPWYSFKEQLAMPKTIDKEVDLMHFLHFNVPLFYSRPFVVTIHDLILFKFPTRRASQLNSLLYRIKNAGYRRTLKKSADHSQKIITVSNFTKKDLEENFPQTKDKIKVIYEACEKDEKKLKLDENSSSKRWQELAKKYGITTPYLLYVGGAYPHKNLENLLLAFRELKYDQKNSLLKDIKLLMVGGDDYFYQQIKSFATTNKVPAVKFLGLVKEENDLDLLYENAELFVLPSIYEGFGLPPLEALSLGIPVAVSKSGSLPEILKDGAQYFNPYQPGDIAQKIRNILLDKKLSEKILKKGRERLKDFSWGKTAQGTLKVYDEVMKNL